MFRCYGLHRRVSSPPRWRTAHYAGGRPRCREAGRHSVSVDGRYEAAEKQSGVG
jgi:hypothetical protein